MPREVANHFHSVDDFYALHRSKVDSRAVVDFLAREDRPFDDVFDVGPIADLRSVAPHFEWILPEKGARNHGYDGVILHTPRSVHREVATEGGAHAVFLGIRAESKFAHQLGPAISVIGVVRTFG